jgi:hypothetical protein
MALWIGQRKMQTIRWVCSAAVFYIFLLIATKSYSILETIDMINNEDLTLPDRLYNDVTKSSIDIKLEQSRSLFSYNLLLGGVLWGMIIIKKDSPAIAWTDVPEWIMFVLANLAIAVNGFCFFSYVSLVSSLLASAGNSAIRPESIPDLYDRRIDLFAATQQHTLFLILLMVGLLFLSTHRLKEPPL